MTIEASAASSMARPSESRGVRNKQGNDGDGGGGFTAVLAAAETPENTQASATGESAAGSQKPTKPAEAKTQAKAKGVSVSHEARKADATPTKDAAGAPEDMAATADVCSNPVPPGGDGAVPADPAVAALALLQTSDTAADPMDATALLAQSAAWGASSIATSGSDAAAKSPGDLQNALPGATAVASKVTNSGTTGPRPAVTPVSVPEGGAQSTALQTEQPSEGLQKALKTAVEAKGMAATQAVPKAESAQPVDGKLAALLNQKPVDGDTAQLATTLASAAANVVSTPRREESSRERSVFRTSNDSAASPQALSTPAPTHIVSGAPEVVPATDVFVAEKVSYWVSNNVQNAEMKLDGVGDRPVEVSIRMQGNEAHVAFRTDELQTRAALENASVHLKDLLHREGLVLSGVSVGTADTGGSSGPQQDRKPRQGERQATVTALQPLTGDLRTGPGRVSRGSLDLFV